MICRKFDTDVYHLLRVGSAKYPVLFNRLQCVDIQAIIRLLEGYFMIFLFICLQSRRIFLNLQIIKNNSSIVATIALHIIKALAFIFASQNRQFLDYLQNNKLYACANGVGYSYLQVRCLAVPKRR